MTTTAKAWIIRFVAITLVLVAFYFIKGEFDDLDKYPTGEPLNEDSLRFNSEEWKKEREYYEDMRPYMLNDLMTNVLKPGMDSSRVKDLLGENRWSHNNRWWSYRLGIYRDLEASYLKIEFDDEGKLRRAGIAEQ